MTSEDRTKSSKAGDKTPNADITTVIGSVGDQTFDRQATGKIKEEQKSIVMTNSNSPSRQDQNLGKQLSARSDLEKEATLSFKAAL